jgi:hypothetical protein
LVDFLEVQKNQDQVAQAVLVVNQREVLLLVLHLHQRKFPMPMSVGIKKELIN